MSDMRSTDEPVRMVRYCIRGHEIIYRSGEIVRSVCPYCKSPIDRSRPPVPFEEAQKRKEEAEQNPGTQNTEPVPDMFGTASRMPGGRPGPGAGSQNAPGPGIPAFRGNAFQGPGSGIGQGIPGIRRGGFPGSQIGRQGMSAGPASQAAGSQGAPSQEPSGFCLNYFGERAVIPAEGAWIGREGLGSQWFDGNLMISRKHVYVRPNPQTGRLQVNEDKSLNGVFYSGADGQRVKMEGARMMSPGEILWIYNIPLKIEN